jgi:hypothetical protein
MQIDALALRMRPRAPLEAADLGVRLAQGSARSLYACYAVAYLPVVLLALASFDVAAWLPPIVIFMAKPWLDRTILFVLARAAFGQDTSVGDLWRARGQIWWQQFFLSWTWRRLSPWRSFTQPVYQLEGLTFGKLGSRVRQIRRRRKGAALMMTTAFSISETCLEVALASLLVWFAPADEGLGLIEAFWAGEGTLFAWVSFVSYVVVVAFIEPFYVSAGFAMYLNRRAELEAWDVEQELRRAFAA